MAKKNLSDMFWESETGQYLSETESQVKLWAYVQIGLLSVIAVFMGVLIFMFKRK